MTPNEQTTLLAHLRAYVERIGSQNKAAQQIGVSAATISAIMNEQWERLKDEMLRRIAEAVRPTSTADWAVVETHALREMHDAFRLMQSEAGCLWITGEAGCGKSTAARLYCEQEREAFYILCSEDMHKADFVRSVADAIGLRWEGMTLRETLAATASALSGMEAPLLLFDEGDKVSDGVLHYYISLYNHLEDSCAMVFLSTDYIERRLRTGLRYGKRGYKEVSSRIGRKFFALDPTSAHDVAAIAMANGITSPRVQASIIREAEDYDFDLRRVKKSVRRERRSAQ